MSTTRRAKPIAGFLRLTGAVRHDAAIDRWLDAQPGERGATARRWFACQRACGDDVRELMHDGCPTACVADAPFAYVGVYTAHVNLGFFHGDALADPAGLLRGNGRFMRHVTLRPGDAVPASALEALVTAAHRDIHARLRGTASPSADA